jgi:putative salt-induced outer membrane protein YdiY
MKVKNIIIVFLILLNSGIILAQEEKKARTTSKKLLSTNISFGFNYLTGNTEKIGANASLKAAINDSLREFSLNARYLFNKTNDILDQREAGGGVQYDHRPNYFLSPFARAEIYSNSFQKIKTRTSGILGLKYTFFKWPSGNYSISAAFMADIEKYIAEENLPVQNKYRFSTRIKFKQVVMENISLNHETYYVPLLKDFYDYRVKSITSINFKINKIVTLKCAYDFDYNSKPVDETVKKTDNKLYLNLSFSF